MKNDGILVTFYHFLYPSKMFCSWSSRSLSRSFDGLLDGGNFSTNLEPGGHRLVVFMLSYPQVWSHLVMSKDALMIRQTPQSDTAKHLMVRSCVLLSVISA